MSKNTGDPFAGLTGDNQRTAADDAAALHGSNAFGSVQSIRVTKLAIDTVHPDSSQPRRVIPFEVRQEWNPIPAEMQEFLASWMKNVDIDPKAYFEPGYEAPQYKHPVRLSLQKIIRLAADIKSEGLTVPITVIRDGQNAYKIETGERRWVAFHLLKLLFGEKYAEIPSRVMNERSVWRQASENNQRADLNAISKARQYAVLVMDASDEVFKPIEAFGTAYEYYAQAADVRIPYGYGEKIQRAMGFESRASVDRYRALFKLQSNAWVLADDFDIPESVLRPVLNELPEIQLEVVENWIKSQLGNVTNGDNSQAEKQDPYAGTLFEKAKLPKVTNRMRRLWSKARHGDEKAKRELLDQLNEYESWISSVRKTIK